jgi:hypothetical protein
VLCGNEATLYGVALVLSSLEGYEAQRQQLQAEINMMPGELEVATNHSLRDGVHYFACML